MNVPAWQYEGLSSPGFSTIALDQHPAESSPMNWTSSSPLPFGPPTWCLAPGLWTVLRTAQSWPSSFLVQVMLRAPSLLSESLWRWLPLWCLCSWHKICHSFQRFQNCDDILSQSRVVLGKSHNTFNIFLHSVICHCGTHGSLLPKLSFDPIMAWIPSSWYILDEFVNRKLHQLLFSLQHMDCCCASVKEDHNPAVSDQSNSGCFKQLVIYLFFVFLNFV